MRKRLERVVSYSGIDSGEKLLAIDLGLRTGMALYCRDCSLLWYRSRHFADRKALKRRVHSLLGEIPGLCTIIVEGRGDLAEIWKQEAVRLNLQYLQVDAEEWRKGILYRRERRTGKRAKLSAEVLARKVVDYCSEEKPTCMRHDTAEAILLGFWGLKEIGWMEEPPPEIFRNSIVSSH